MKDLWKSGVIILLIIGVLYIIFLRECKHPLPCPAQDEVIIKKVTWDSIKSLADKPPVVRIDTQYIQGSIVYVPAPVPTPNPDPQDSTINHYSDSLVNENIDVHINFTIQGTLLHREWWYKPIYMYITRDSIIYVPKFVEIVKPVIVSKNALYGNLVFGGNKESFLFGAGLDLITKKQTQIGYQYQRFGDQNFHSIKLGAALFRRTTK